MKLCNFLEVFAEENSIELYNFTNNLENELNDSPANNTTDNINFNEITVYKDWVVVVLQTLLTISSPMTLIIGNIDDFSDCVIIACLRKLQRWSITSVLSEFVILSGRKDICAYYDLWQFIETFNSNILETYELLPEFMKYYLPVEDKIKDRNTENIGEYLLISDDVTYDPVLSLVADQEDDD